MSGAAPRVNATNSRVGELDRDVSFTLLTLDGFGGRFDAEVDSLPSPFTEESSPPIGVLNDAMTSKPASSSFADTLSASSADCLVMTMRHLFAESATARAFSLTS